MVNHKEITVKIMEKKLTIFFNPYLNVKETHRVVNGKVCCIGHCCDWHYRTEKEFMENKE